MKFKPEQINAVKCMNENGNETFFAWHKDVNKIKEYTLVKDDDVWRLDSCGDWFWSTVEKYQEDGWDLSPLLEQEENKIVGKDIGVTRIVLDVTWEGLNEPYGKFNGTHDDGTVAAITDALAKLIENGDLKAHGINDKPPAVATGVKWISYVTNVEHKLSLYKYISNGRALHPVLRKSKGLISQVKKKTETKVKKVKDNV